MITDEGKKAIARLIASSFNKIDLGDGSDTTNPRQTSLDSTVLTAKQTSTNTVVSDTVVEFTKQFTGSQIQGNTISELGIFGDSDTETIPNSGAWADIQNKLLSRVTFTSQGPFSSSDQITFTLKVEVE